MEWKIIWNYFNIDIRFHINSFPICIYENHSQYQTNHANTPGYQENRRYLEVNQ